MGRQPSAGWYPDRGVPRQLRYWDGQAWSGLVWPASAPPPEPADRMCIPDRPPRSRRRRVLLAGLLWFPVQVASLALMLLARTAGAPGYWVDWISVLPLLGIYGPLASLVSYRKRDVLLVLVPVWQLIWTMRITWRVVFLPYRDWPPRPHEGSDWFNLAGLTAPTAPVFVTPTKPTRTPGSQ
jgi:hypothetical protein